MVTLLCKRRVAAANPVEAEVKTQPRPALQSLAEKSAVSKPRRQGASPLRGAEGGLDGVALIRPAGWHGD